MADALEIGLSALKAHQRALEVAGHNIANASTPGYSRQLTAFTTPQPESVTPGMLGRGVMVDAVRRSVDDLLIERLRQAQSEGDRLERIHSVLSAVESTFDEPGDSGFAASVNRFFAAFEDLASNPEASPMRAAIVSEMRAFPARLNSLASQFDSLRDDLANGLSIQLTRVNSLTAGVAKLNQSIAREVLVGNNPNDLLDQREGMLKELSGMIGLRVSIDPRDQTARVSLGGRLLISADHATDLIASHDGDGGMAVAFADGVRAELSSGSIGAAIELHNEILPGYRDQLDQIAAGIVHAFNVAQSTGTGSDVRNSRFVSQFAVDVAKRGVDLDDPSQALVGTTGIPQAFLPSFTDVAGVSQTRNLELNVLDTTTGVASKYVIRYDPGTDPLPASRSLDDLISAINTGRGGGFSVYPPVAGIPGITAGSIATDGGLKLELQADPGLSIDFSRALDLQPSASAWSGGTVSVSGLDVALAGKRLELSVQAGGTQLALNYRDPATGNLVPYPAAGSNTVAIPTGGATVIGGLTVTAGAGSYVDGQSFTVDLDRFGAITGAVTQAPTWTAGSAVPTFSGRYTGGMAFDPAQPWSMRVLSSGVVGAAAGTAPPNGPPVVEFSYWTMQDGAAVNRTVTRTLDATARSGTLVEIADGVTASFGDGSLTAGDQIGITVDGQPDQAGLLPALGINAMFRGYDAATIDVAPELLEDADRLSTGWTRAPGDNAGVRTMLAVRDQPVIGAESIEEAYRSTVSDLGVRVSQAKRLSETQDLIGTSLENRRSDVSGVNIDEEVGRMIQEQQAYTAAARLITTTRENIQTLMDLLR